MYSMNEIVWDKPVDYQAQAAACCIKLSIGISNPTQKTA